MNGTPVITCPSCQAQRTGGSHECLPTSPRPPACPRAQAGGHHAPASEGDHS
jgi:hypothetical protein